MVLKERENPIVEKFRRGHRDLGRVDLGKGYRRISVNDRLLVNPSPSLFIKLLTQVRLPTNKPKKPKVNISLTALGR